VAFASAAPCSISSTGFLDHARAALLARYTAMRSDALDAILDRAGILRYFAEHTGQAVTMPDVEAPPRPELNQPFSAAP